MESETSSLSQSTLHRYHEAHREQDLPRYQQLKTENKSLASKISQQQIRKLKLVYLHGIAGRNGRNQLVVVDRIGSLKINDITKIMDEDSLVAYSLSRMIFISQEVLEQREKVLWIIDVGGKIMQLASKKVYSIMARIIKMAAEHFPDMLAKMIFVNTPMLFDTVWSQLSLNVPEETEGKVQFLADLEELHEMVDIAILPQFLGGELDDSILMDGKASHLKVVNDSEGYTFKSKSMGIDKKKTELFSSPPEEKQEQEAQQVDFSSLKAALSGMSFGKSSNFGGIPSVAQTPLNTEADDR